MILKGRTALITGASRGLGRHLAHVLARDGMKLSLTARSSDDLRSVAAECEELGAEAIYTVADVRSHADLSDVVTRTHDAYGSIDVLVNNAGLSWFKPLAEWSVEEIDMVVDANLKGTIYAAALVAPTMVAQKRGHIVNVASDVGRRAIPNMGPYVAAKHGVVGFSGSLLREVKPHGVKVTVVLPGIIDTYFGGATEGERDPSWSMDPKDVAAIIRNALIQPDNMTIDEIQLHPTGQDF